MKEDTMLLIRNLRNDIRNKLTKEESVTLDYIIDSLTYEKYSSDMILGDYFGRYDVILIDGTKIKDVEYLEGDFFSEKEFKHPQMIIWEDKQLNKRYYHITDKLVKYIRRYN